METVDQEMLYSRISAKLYGMIDVFVDGSYSDAADSSGCGLAPFGAGWAIPHAGKKRLAGYGMMGFRAEATNGSEVSELRAILSFIDTLREFYPHLNTRENVFRIHSDNKNLVTLLQNNLSEMELSPGMRGRFGVEYLRIEEARKRINLSFHWVKGHDGNPFNEVADSFARHYFRQMLLGKEFHGQPRRKFINDVLIKEGLLPSSQKMPVCEMPAAVRNSAQEVEIISAEEERRRQGIRDAKKAEKQRWIDGQRLGIALQAVRSDSGTASVLSFESDACADSDPIYGHINSSDSQDISLLAIQLRSLNSVLGLYRNSDSFNAKRYVTVHNNLRYGSPIAGAIVNNTDVNVSGDDILAHQEIAELRRLLSGLKIRFVDSVNNELEELLFTGGLMLKKLQ